MEDLTTRFRGKCFVTQLRNRVLVNFGVFGCVKNRPRKVFERDSATSRGRMMPGKLTVVSEPRFVDYVIEFNVSKLFFACIRTGPFCVLNGVLGFGKNMCFMFVK